MASGVESSRTVAKRGRVLRYPNHTTIFPKTLNATLSASQFRPQSLSTLGVHLVGCLQLIVDLDAILCRELHPSLLQTDVVYIRLAPGGHQKRIAFDHLSLIEGGIGKDFCLETIQYLGPQPFYSFRRQNTSYSTPN